MRLDEIALTVRDTNGDRVGVLDSAVYRGEEDVRRENVLLSAFIQRSDVFDLTMVYVHGCWHRELFFFLLFLP